MRQLDHAGRSRCIVVSAWVYGPRHGRRHGKLFSQAQMIVMRSHDYIFRCFAGQVSAHVVHRLHLAADIDVHFQVQCGWQGEGLRMKVLIDRSLNRFQILTCQRQPFGGEIRLHLCEFDARVAGSGSGAELLQLVGIVRMRGNIVYQEHSLGPVHLGVHSLVHRLGVGGVAFALEDTLVVEFLGFVTKHENDFVLGIQAGIVVVVVLGRGDSVSGEDHLATDLALRGEIQRHEILLALERLLLAAVRILQLIARAQARAGGDFEILIVARAVERLQIHGVKLIADERCRFLKLRRSGSAATHFGRCQVFDVAKIFGGAQLGGKQSAS